MLTHLLHLIGPPPFADEEQQRVARARRNEQALAISNTQLRQETAHLEILVDIDKPPLDPIDHSTDTVVT